MANPKDAPASGESPIDALWARIERKLLYGLAVLYLLSAVGSFVESFHGLIDWFDQNNYQGFYAFIAPAMIDIVTVFSEALLLMAMIRHWPVRVRLAAWTGTVLSLAVSITGNVGREGWPAHPLHHLGTLLAYAIPPLALTGLTALGLIVVKRYFGRDDNEAGPGRTPENSDVPADALLALLHFREDVYAGVIPSVRDVRARVSCGQPRAERIRAYLKDFQTVLAPETVTESDKTREESAR